MASRSAAARPSAASAASTRVATHSSNAVRNRPVTSTTLVAAVDDDAFAVLLAWMDASEDAVRVADRRSRLHCTRCCTAATPPRRHDGCSRHSAG
ncbi:MAG TPA: hypothetical protein VN306_05335 [Mycobacterium sp.]|nr:hypothetical protein [Mycobacterium sp.]